MYKRILSLRKRQRLGGGSCSEEELLWVPKRSEGSHGTGARSRGNKVSDSRGLSK